MEDRNEQPEEELGQTSTFRDRGGPDTVQVLSYARDRKEVNVAVMWVSECRLVHDEFGEVGKGQIIVRNLNLIQRNWGFLMVC